MDYIQGTPCEQRLLFLDVIDAFVDRLDLEALGFQKSQIASTGRPSIHPDFILPVEKWPK